MCSPSCSLFKVLTRRICLIINSFFSGWSFTLFFWPYCAIQGWYCIEKLDAVSLWGQRARNFSFVFATLSAKFTVFFVQRNIDGVNNCTVDSNLTFTPQIFYSTRNQERICPLLYNYIIQIRKGTLTDRGFFFLPELTEQKQTTNDWLYACTSSKENDFLHIFLLVNFKFPLIFLSCICSFYASSLRR